MAVKDKANIAIDSEVVGVDEITLHPFNARKGDIAAIMMSLERFGQQKPIVVDDDNVVVAGNHTLQAAKKLGWKTIAIVRGGLAGDDALAYLLADNRASDRARYKATEMGELLQTQLDMGNLEGTGYDVDDVEDFQAQGAGGGEDGPDIPGGGGSSDGNGGPPPAEAPAKREPIREVVMMMPQSQAIEFGQQVSKLQKEYGTSTVVDTVRRAVAERAEALADLPGDPDENGDPPFEPDPPKAKRKVKGAEATSANMKRLAEKNRARASK